MSAPGRQPYIPPGVEPKDASAFLHTRASRLNLKRMREEPAAEQPALFAVSSADEEPVVPTSPSRASASAAHGLVARTADLSLSRPPEWVWQDRIVLSALNLIVGQEGAGKGTLACWIFAQLTRGTLPGSLYGKPARVGIIGDEDSFEGVWIPRLNAAGADLDRIKVIERGDGSLIELAADHERLVPLVRGMRLLYLDQLTDNLGAAINDWRGKQVREALVPARQIARELGTGVLGTLHPNKSGETFRQLMSGSTAFNAVSRSSLLLAEHPDDPDRRVITRAKGNLAATPEAVEFAIEGYTFTANGHTFDVPRAVDFGTSRLTTADLLTTPASPVGDARTDARELVAGWLEDGEWHDAGEIIADCKAKGGYERAAQRAADDLGVEKKKRGFPARSHWRLTRQEATALSPVTPVASVTSADLALIGRGDRDDTDDRGASVTSAVTTEATAVSRAPTEAASADVATPLAAAVDAGDSASAEGLPTPYDPMSDFA